MLSKCNVWIKAAAQCTSWQCLVTASFKAGSFPSLSTSGRSSYIVCCIGGGSKKQYPVTNSFAEGREWMKKGGGDGRGRGAGKVQTQNQLSRNSQEGRNKLLPNTPRDPIEQASKPEHHRLYHWLTVWHIEPWLGWQVGGDKSPLMNILTSLLTEPWISSCSVLFSCITFFSSMTPLPSLHHFVWFVRVSLPLMGLLHAPRRF